MTLTQHIEELSAELRGIDDPGERRQIERELAEAKARLRGLDLDQREAALA